MRAYIAWEEAPKSREIAAHLNATYADVCFHFRNPCYLRCGVKKVRGVWTPIAQADRLNWKRGLLGPHPQAEPLAGLAAAAIEQSRG